MEQSFLVTIVLGKVLRATSVAPSKKALITLLSSLTAEDYIFEITPLEDFYKFGELMVEVKNENKPEGLEYGGKKQS